MARRHFTGRDPRKGSSQASSVLSPSSPRYGDSLKLHGSSSHSRTRGPSPASERITGVKIERDIEEIRNVPTQRFESSDSADSVQRPSKRRKVTSPTIPGRGIRKIIDLYHDLPDLVAKADKHAFMSTLRPEKIQEALKNEFVGLKEDQIEEEQRDCKRCHTAMQLLDKLIPGFQRKARTAVDINILCAPLQSGANDARSDNTSQLKMAIAEWLNSRQPSNDLGSWLSAKGKDERGIRNDTTGRLLCPIDYNWDDPKVRAKLRAGAPGYDFTSSFFLRCLYDGENGDPEDPEEGFLKGPLLLLAYRHIFTSPSSAFNDPENAASKSTSRRRDVATTLRMNGQVTPRSIAYTATQVVFSLNSAREWRSEHAGFHYPSFYNFLVDYFEDPNADDEVTERVNELLVWWNSKIFPTALRKSGGAASRRALKSSLKRLQEARERHGRV